MAGRLYLARALRIVAIFRRLWFGVVWRFDVGLGVAVVRKHGAATGTLGGSLGAGGQDCVQFVGGLAAARAWRGAVHSADFFRARGRR